MKTKKQDRKNLLQELDAARVQQDALVESLKAHEERLAVLEANLAANPNGAKPEQDAELGRVRREVKCAEKDVLDGQLAFCKLGDEETVARFVLADERWRAARAEIGKLQEQAASLETSQGATHKRLKSRENEFAERAQVGEGLVTGALSDYLGKQTERALIESDKVRRSLSNLGEEQAVLDQRLADCRRELGEQEKIRQEILAAGKSKLCELEGSPDQIEARLSDPRVTVDRRAIRNLLAELAKGVNETIPSGLQLVSHHCTIDDIRIYFWADTGAIEQHLIHAGRGPEGPLRKVWERHLFNNREARANLEIRRQGREATAEKALVGA